MRHCVRPANRLHQPYAGSRLVVTDLIQSSMSQPDTEDILQMYRLLFNPHTRIIMTIRQNNAKLLESSLRQLSKMLKFSINIMLALGCRPDPVKYVPA